MTDEIALTLMQYGRLLMVSVETYGCRNLLISRSFLQFWLFINASHKIANLSSKTATLKLICRLRQPFFIYLSSLIGCITFIKSNCGVPFGRNVVILSKFYCISVKIADFDGEMHNLNTTMFLCLSLGKLWNDDQVWLYLRQILRELANRKL